jgi:hypothetical protein
VEESGQITAINSHEDLGMMIGLLHRPSHSLTLPPKVFSKFERLSVEDLLRQLAPCMDKPNSWTVMADVKGEIVVWPESDAVNGLRSAGAHSLSLRFLHKEERDGL